MTALLDLREHLPITNPTWIFFLVLCIILFAPVLLIPHIIGMILAGILIGEHGFDILARDSSFELFGQVGLYYIMFLAGLEMNMEDFPAIRGKAIVFGILAFIIPIVLGFFSNILILKYGIVSSILLASMYASHTLISYPIVTRYGVSRHRCVSIAVGATAITDSLTLLVLAIVGSMYRTDSVGSWSWLELILKVSLMGLFIILLSPHRTLVFTEIRRRYRAIHLHSGNGFPRCRFNGTGRNGRHTWSILCGTGIEPPHSPGLSFKELPRICR